MLLGSLPTSVCQWFVCMSSPVFCLILLPAPLFHLTYLNLTLIGPAQLLGSLAGQYVPAVWVRSLVWHYALLVFVQLPHLCLISTISVKFAATKAFGLIIKVIFYCFVLLQDMSQRNFCMHFNTCKYIQWYYVCIYSAL